MLQRLNMFLKEKGINYGLIDPQCKLDYTISFVLNIELIFSLKFTSKNLG